ncbi:O6-methylguanine-DNA methyltransferase [Ktedonobacteria bacterium brp13]|nr:O6-methylguanine-DNA methyltransferase [Ktedonobacteria bacterium brp13]
MVRIPLDEKGVTTALDEELYWQAVLARDKQADGQFVFGVHSTGIYCRPSCPARRPRRENVSFFLSVEAAEHAGFRSCRRCLPAQEVPAIPQAEVVEQICNYIATHLDDSLHLAALSEYFHLSPSYLQRTFKRVTGVSPRQYAESCRLEQFKQRLHDGEAVTSALYSAGYQSSSPVYGLAPARLGMTPAVYRQGGKGMRIQYAIAQSEPGYVLLAATKRGIAAVRFGETEQALRLELEREYPAAEIVAAEQEMSPWMELLFQLLRGQASTQAVSFDVQATVFQCKVWEALRAIPSGETRSYYEIACVVGQPAATRAVARACAANPIAVFIPCHRVVRSNGETGGYRWGIERKKQLLELEARKAREVESFSSECT